jgi:uncharacterized membrane protein YukC
MRKTAVLFFTVLVAVFFLVSALHAQDELFEKGRRAYLKKDYRTAVKYLREYVARTPDPQALYLLGYANYEVKRKGPRRGKKNFWGDTETAEYFKEAYLIDPKVSAQSIDLKKGK